MKRERWTCPKCGHVEELLPGTKYYFHRFRKGIVEQVHEMKKDKTDG